MSKLKIQLAQINTSVGDLDGNCQKILQAFKAANEAGCDLVVFPEMTICGYDAQDLWHKKYFISAIKEKILEILSATRGSKCAILLGAPMASNSRSKEILFNSALLIEDGELKKIINKKTLAIHTVFDERRYFESDNLLSFVEFRGQTLAILICEDLWDARNIFMLGEQVFDTVISINSSPYATKKNQYRHKVAQDLCKKLSKPLVYVNQVGGQDSVVFDGSSFVMNSAGEILLQMKDFVEDFASVEIEKSGEIKSSNCHSSFMLGSTEQARRNYYACVLALRDYVKKNNFSKVLLGMSGGIDSALIAAIAVDALGSGNVFLYALPSRYNSETSMDDAQNCAKNLNVNLGVISIEMALSAMLISLGDITDLAKENLQSRIRGNMLMAISNSTGALLLSTGNKSELACGYATIYGDMCGAFNPIKDLYKMQVYELAKWRNENVPEIALFDQKNLIPENILTKAPTAELRENQKDSDSLPEYEILDKILFQLIEEQKSVAEIIEAGFESELVKKIAKLLYASEYKRRQSCLGPKISDMAFDKDRRYPITNKFVK